MAPSRPTSHLRHVMYSFHAVTHIDVTRRQVPDGSTSSSSFERSVPIRSYLLSVSATQSLLKVGIEHFLNELKIGANKTSNFAAVKSTILSDASVHCPSYEIESRSGCFRANIDNNWSASSRVSAPLIHPPRYEGDISQGRFFGAPRKTNAASCSKCTSPPCRFSPCHFSPVSLLRSLRSRNSQPYTRYRIYQLRSRFRSPGTSSFAD